MNKHSINSLVWLLFICLFITNSGEAAIKDAESASHGTDASQYQIVDTYKFNGYELVQINLPVLSHYSYILISEGKSLIVDPGRDVQFYVDLIKEKNLSVDGIFLTHSHADFVAGHTELVKLYNCPIYQSAKSGAEYKIEPIADGSNLQIGKAYIQFIDTPGHVLDGTSAIIGPTKDLPELILTGDFLFVGGVGRPDLVTGTTSSALAGMLFDTWVEKVSKLPDSVKVFPAHGAGSLCGAHLKDQPFSTIGEERTSNPTLQHKNRSEFITAVLSELQEPPQYFGHNAAMNRTGPPLVNWDETVSILKPEASLTDFSKNYIIDLRDSSLFAAGHILNSVNIALRGRFETWTGIMVPWGSNTIVCGTTDEIKEAAHRLHRIGYTAKGLVFDEWAKADMQLLKNKLISPRELYDQMQANTNPIIVDVRLPSEWMGLRIGTVLNLPLNKLSELSNKLDVSQPVVAVCNSAYRSSMAIGILERRGMKNATSLEGGSEAWIEAGFPVYGSEQAGASASTQIRKMIALPERICARELKRLMMDLPGTFQIVDIRPKEMFDDYSIPGSQNVDIVEIVSNPSYLVETSPLIIVDRDGSYAMAIGGILSQKTSRPIKVLYEGLESYWMESDFSGTSVPMNATTPQIQISPPASSSTPAAPSVTQPVTKKKSAGC
ncbi:MAG: MBL fold metallo-hydrolase [Sedimentisphaerales bacterium]|nr:MBL fold metallo-hydrolase [Sedimentisphaerales bacterium]